MTTQTPDSASSIVVDRVSQWFGNVVAVSDVSFDVPPGVTGLIGPNGAGKSTLLRAITGMQHPSSGEVRVLGGVPRTQPELYRRIGVMTEHEAVWDMLTAREFVAVSARLHRVQDVSLAVTNALKTVDMLEAADRRLSKFSRGMRQRTRLAAALVHDPEVLILDEPMSGIDPVQRDVLSDVLKAYGDQGRTVLVSSHILEEVERIADSVHVIVGGKLAASGRPSLIRLRLNERPMMIRVRSDDPRRLGGALLQTDSVESIHVVSNDELRVATRDLTMLQRALPRAARDLGVRLTWIEPLDDSLDSVFAYLTDA